jgi:hypothetical protein
VTPRPAPAAFFTVAARCAAAGGGQIVLKATKVGGVYTADPMRQRRRATKIAFEEAFVRTPGDGLWRSRCARPKLPIGFDLQGWRLGVVMGRRRVRP